ncbi:hypothetical protein H2200_004362 [Cladophialophora chaetospira]|uniref:Uncharacterized protein n=1 Tax=Cladophialophora chaetospira TaxID=386627 RepID=A0AA39CKD0_9EURO|nr:hypothetical protein H2200_004362 [Cladophialophora chaetospira]
MPWPAKPPMTLKEAKRAYKKEGATFRYTASQLARADRIDAKEDKRKKELEKERLRAENKRKREEKEDRDRQVRQKMLDEGRISVEDTWGKVTASQPRLNKFFGRKPVVAPSRSNLRAELTADREDSSPRHGHAAGSQDKEETAPESQDAPQQDVPAAVAGITPDTTPSHQRNVLNDVSQSAASRPVRREFMSSSHSQPAIPRELKSSELNARSSAPARSLPANRGLSPNVVSSSIGSNAKLLPASISPRFTGRPLESPPASSGSNTISEGSTTEFLPETTTIYQHGQKLGHDETHYPGSPSERKEDMTTLGGEPSLAPSLDLTDDEDFTDGLDDETFLLLCATQKPAEESAPMCGNSPSTGSALSASTETCPKPETNHESQAVFLSTEAVASIPHGLSESFNSVFNEFEDEDLIALAEEVEASIGTPKDTFLVTPTVETEKATSRPPAYQPNKPPGDFAKPQLPRVRHNVSSLTEMKAKDISSPGGRQQEASSKTVASP